MLLDQDALFVRRPFALLQAVAERGMPREGTATEERSRGKNKRHGSVNRVCRLCNVAAPRASACVCACVCARGSARTTRTGHGTLRSGSIAPWHARTEPRSPEAISSIPWPVGPNMVRIIRSHRRQKRGTQHALPPERVPIYRTPLAPVEKTRNKTPSNKNKKQTVHERRPGGGFPKNRPPLNALRRQARGVRTRRLPQHAPVGSHTSRMSSLPPPALPGVQVVDIALAYPLAEAAGHLRRDARPLQPMNGHEPHDFLVLRTAGRGGGRGGEL